MLMWVGFVLLAVAPSCLGQSADYDITWAQLENSVTLPPGDVIWVFNTSYVDEDQCTYIKNWRVGAAMQLGDFQSGWTALRFHRRQDNGIYRNLLTLDGNMRALTVIFDKNDLNNAWDLCFWKVDGILNREKNFYNVTDASDHMVPGYQYTFIWRTLK